MMPEQCYDHSSQCRESQSMIVRKLVAGITGEIKLLGERIESRSCQRGGL